jgi:hypothetical protein
MSPRLSSHFSSCHHFTLLVINGSTSAGSDAASAAHAWHTRAQLERRSGSGTCCLELKRCHLHSLEPQPQQEQQGCDSPSCFSALTAASHTAHSPGTEERTDVPVPKAAFDHIVAVDRVLAHLKVLRLSSYGFKHCVEEPQVVRIAASCPALQELTLKGVTPRGVDVSCLLQLPQGVGRVQGLDWTRPDTVDAS